jgi:hypothetical protein
LSTDYDAWRTGGNWFACVRCGRRFEEHSYSADLCPMCQDELDERRVKMTTTTPTIMGRTIEPWRPLTLGGMQVLLYYGGPDCWTCEANWGCLGMDETGRRDSRGSLKAQRMTADEAVRDMDAQLAALIDAIDPLLGAVTTLAAEELRDIPGLVKRDT